jgi:acyl-CoA hydrolase
MPDVSDVTSVAAKVTDGCAVIVPIANGEPVALITALDDRADSLRDVTVHQMHALHDHPYLHAVRGDRLRHISYFLSHITRPAYRAGTLEFVPANFSEIPSLLSRVTQPKVVYSERGTAFVVLHSTTHDGLSRIVSRLSPVRS